MKILITGVKGQLGNELVDIINSGSAEIGSISEKVKNSELIGCLLYTSPSPRDS